MSRDQLAEKYRGEHAALQRHSGALREHGVEAVALLAEGEPVAKILAEADSHEVDAIIVGHHRDGVLQNAMAAPIAEALMRRAEVPVVVVPY